MQNEAGQSLIEFCQENALVIANTLFQQHRRRLLTQHQIQIDYIFAAKDGEALYSQQKQGQELQCLRSWTPYCQIQTEIEESGENHEIIQT